MGNNDYNNNILISSDAAFKMYKYVFGDIPNLYLIARPFSPLGAHNIMYHKIGRSNLQSE